MIYDFHTSLGCHGFDDALLGTMATTRKIKISFVFFKLSLSEHDVLSFHNEVCVHRRTQALLQSPETFPWPSFLHSSLSTLLLSSFENTYPDPVKHNLTADCVS